MSHSPSPGLGALTIRNRFTEALPGDSESANRPRQVKGAAYSFVRPLAPKAPSLVAASGEVAATLGFGPNDIQSPEFTQLFSGEAIMESMKPYALRYGGHQFGNWAGQLGDGRAINLGEAEGVNGKLWALQLKGAGPTPYSRSGDGFAVLRSSVREFLCSEAMHHLGVPTTRALSLITTGDQVLRDMFYDGNPKMEAGAVVCRVSESFTRFGSFQILAAHQELDLLKQLADNTIRWHYPELGEPSPDVYVKWFIEVSRRTAVMITEWMRVGFVHGVMNTDNMSILGETIDYGPYGWLEPFDTQWTPNTTDAQGRRYAFGQQPAIAHWNLAQLANALVPLIGEPLPLQEALDNYPKVYANYQSTMLASKLGLTQHNGEADSKLFSELHGLLQLAETDMTIFYRQLAELDAPEAVLSEGPQTETSEVLSKAGMDCFADAFYVRADITPEIAAVWKAWLDRYRERLTEDASDHRTRKARMNRVNPKFVLRNYLAQIAIEAAEQGDSSKTQELLEVLRAPYDDQPGNEVYALKRPEWARSKPGCSTLSCSS